MPINYSKYPPNWKSEIRPAILKRADNKCEFCGLENYAIGYRNEHGWIDVEKSFAGDMIAEDAKDMGYKVIKIILTVAHLDHDLNNNDYSNLKALCQKCHLNYDHKHHLKNSRNTRNTKKGLTELF